MKNKRSVVLLMVAATMLFSMTACSWLSGLTDTEGDVSPETGQSSSQNAYADPASMPDAPAQTGPTESETNQGAPNNGQGQEAVNVAQGEGECEDRFIQDGASNIVQGQAFEEGESFTVQWPVKNVGTCIWDDGYALTFIGGDLTADAASYPIDDVVHPGETLNLVLELTAPSQTGPAISLWKLQNTDGQLFGMVSPPDAALRVAIDVTQASNANNNGNNNSNVTDSPVAAVDPEIAISGLPNVANSGFGMTMLTDECFDFAEGEVVSCSDSAADFRYDYNTVIHSYLKSQNGTLFSDSQDQAPSENDCQSEDFYGMPLILPAGGASGSYICFETEIDGDTAYGWIQPESYNAGGLTFDFLTFEPQTGFATQNTIPQVNLWLFTLSHGEQETLLVSKCFDLGSGEQAACNSSDADIKYLYASGQAYVEFLGDALMGIGTWNGEQPTRSGCMEKETMAGYRYLNDVPEDYTCYQTVDDGETVYGWFRPTQYNSGGMTFDFQTWEP